MVNMERTHTPLDRLFGRLDEALRTALGPAAAPERPNPAVGTDAELSTEEQLLAQRLMRVNHAGEICAQALYQGQALSARDPEIRGRLERAACEENDHLAWTEQRLRELGGHTSYLNPAWYAGSFAIGAFAGLAGDRWSLGFLAETERQVVRHLDGHLKKLPVADRRSRAILEQMREDEGRHATVAVESGGAPLPELVRGVMGLASKIMTRTAYWI